MNLRLIKIKKQNIFDYNLLSEFMVRKNGKLIFNAGFGNTDKVGEKKQNEKVDLMEKVEKQFQMKSIIKSYNEAFRLHRKSLMIHKTTKKGTNIPIHTLPYLNKRKEILNLKHIDYSNKSKRLTRSSLKTFNDIVPLKGKSANISLGTDLKNEPLDSKEENSIDYNTYFYHGLESFPKGINSEKYENYLYNNNNTTSNKNIYSKNKKRKLLKNNSEDFIFVFGKNKIIKKDKNFKNVYSNTLSENQDNTKSPFIDYNQGHNPNKIKNRLQKNFQFYKNIELGNSDFEKQEYIIKIRKLFENKKNIQYNYEYLPSHHSVKTMIRKREKYEKRK